MYGEYLISINDNFADNTHISEPYGYNLLPDLSTLKEVVKHLNAYIESHTDEEIERENAKRKENVDKYYKDLCPKQKDNSKSSVAGYVYLFKCGEEYKIGYSKNVERRIKELDKRPYPLVLISKIYSDIAYEIEQHLHRVLADYKIKGEWYHLKPDLSAEEFERCVKFVENKFMRCGK